MTDGVGQVRWCNSAKNASCVHGRKHVERELRWYTEMFGIFLNVKEWSVKSYQSNG